MRAAGLSRRIPASTKLTDSSSSSLLLSSLELSDTQVYEPYTRALLGTASVDGFVPNNPGRQLEKSMPT